VAIGRGAAFLAPFNSSRSRSSASRPTAASIDGMATPAPAPAAPQAPQPLCDNLCWLLSRASYTFTTEMTAALEGLGISPRAHAVLAAAATGDRTQTELAKMVGLDKTTMVVTLDELEAAGLAERRPSPNDRRARVIAVTKAGATRLRDAEAIGDAIRDDVLGVLPAGERKAFLGALTKLVGDRLAEPVPCAHPVRRRAPRA
jgi:MarR family transcriptional regulator, transcriptional regulator for hemolysin